MGGFVVLTLATVDVNITGDHEGIFLLKGKGWAILELRDDLFLGEEDRYIAGIDLERKKNFLGGMLMLKPPLRQINHGCAMNGTQNVVKDSYATICQAGESF